MADLNVALIVRLLDQVSAPAQKVRNSLRVIGNETKSFRRDLGQAFRSDFSSGNLAAAIERSETRISQARGRLVGAAGMALTLAAPVIVAGNFEEKMIDFAILAEISREQAEELEGKLDDLRKVTGKSKGELLEGLSAYVGKGLDLDAALASLEATGTAAVATKSQMDEMANSGFAILDNLQVAPALLKKAFDIMATSGKEGSFELAAMARKFPEITAGAKALKMDGVEAVASLSAALQVAMKSAGSEDQAATNLTNFMGKITAPDTVKKFAKFGVNIEKEMELALQRGVDPLEHMLLVIREMTGGDAFKMGELFADKQVLDFLRAAIPNLEEYQRIRDKAMDADGTLDKDALRVLEGFNAQWKLLKDSVTSLLGASGALLPVMTDLLASTRGFVETLADWTKANPELTAMIIKGAAGLLAFGIGMKVVGFGLAIMSNGLLRAARLFFKFNEAGRNVSVIGRVFRATTWSVRGLIRAGRGLARVLTGLPAIKWASLIPKLVWSRFLPAPLALASLIVPLKWTSRLLPSFVAPLARFAAFRTAASTEISGLSRHVATQSAAMNRNLNRVKWGAAGASFMLWSTMRNMPQDPEKVGQFQKGNREAMDAGLRKVPILSQLISGYEKLFETVHGRKPPSSVEDSSTPDMPAPAAGQPDDATAPQTEALRDEIAKLTAEIAAIKDGPMADALKAPLREELARRKAELADMEVKAPAARKETGSAPATSVRPRPASRLPAIDPNLSRAIADALKPIAAVRPAQAPERSVRPRAPSRLPAVDQNLAKAVSDALRPLADTLRSSLRPPEARMVPQDYKAPQPNVDVSSTFQGNTSLAVDVKVSMPITIRREQKINNAAIARDAGRKVGADTERAVRRGLDDAAIAN